MGVSELLLLHVGSYKPDDPTASYSIDNTALTKLFELCPDDPAEGVPHNTGSGLLSSGLMDKRVSHVITLTVIFALTEEIYVGFFDFRRRN